MPRAGLVRSLVAIVFVIGSASVMGPARSSAQVASPSLAEIELLKILGDGVVGNAESAHRLSGFERLARWQMGEWRYRITSGARRGETEVESLTPVSVTARGETWKRTIGQDSTLFLRELGSSSLVLPSQITHPYHGLVYFEPPLIYLVAGLDPGESRVFDGRIDVYSQASPGLKWYTGRIRATTVYTGVYRVTTPAGSFRASLIRTEYQIDIFATVSVRDTLYTFYAEGIGKVAEAEHRRIAAMGLFNSDTKIGKVLVSYTSVSPPPRIESP